MKKTLLIIAILLVATSLEAQIPAGYYNNAQGKTGEELRAALHNIIRNHTVVSYEGLYTAYAYTDCDADGKIWDIYSNYRYDLSQKCGTCNVEGRGYNREHTWPQSWFGKGTPKSDLFHVMPTDGHVNNMRSNYPYGEVNNPTYTSGNGSKVGPCSTSGYTGTVFEPVDEYKGDIARNFFYMSTRYYGEDSGWSSSGMTTKCEIKSWAMTMLLRWSDEDPVSQKEIDRNNAVYGFQGNRNPFIDHPEYARMIWDPTWQGQSFGITYASGLNHGSVSGPNSAYAGNTVSLVASPDPGYMVDQWNVFKTGYPNTHVTVSNNTFVMPEYDVTVSATFKTNSTIYNITLESNSHGSISVSPTSGLSGTTITMTATPASGYHLYSWYVYKTGDMNTTVPVSGNTFVMPAFNVTVRASFSDQSGSTEYVKVTESPTDWSGEYLLVYEDPSSAAVAWTGVDAANCNVAVTISNGVITEKPENAVSLIIAPMAGGYSIKVNGGTNDGKYIYGTADSNKLNFGTSPSLNTISHSGGFTVITSNTSVMRFNTGASDKRFRYYKSTTTNYPLIQLYKKQGGGGGNTPTHTIHFHPNGGQGTMNDQEVPEFTPTPLNPSTFTREHFTFDGWNTEANEIGTYYADEATVIITDDLDLYAVWDPQFHIVLVQAAHGTISADTDWASEGDDVTLTSEPDEGYELVRWIVTDGFNNEISVSDDSTFEMPADNVSVTAIFEVIQMPFEQNYYLVTSADQLVAGRTYLIVNNSAGKALGKTQNTNNRSAATISVSSGTISTLGDACELLLGGEAGQWTLYDNTNKSGYLYAAGGNSTNNYLRTQDEPTDAGKWSISIDTENAATIKTIDGTVNRHTIMYNKNNASNLIFSCYDSGQQPVSLYLRSEDYHITTNAVIANLTLFDFDRCIVNEGATLTITGTTQTSSQAQIVLKEGAQLIQHNEGVRIAVEKNIEAYTDDLNGWQCIASPLTETREISEIEGLTNEPFDLYTLGTEEWIAKRNGNEALANGEGYLFAHGDDQAPIRFVGTAKACSQSITKSLYYNNTAPEKSFSLVGNPFTCNALVNRNYYSIVENGGICTFTEKSTNDPIPPCTSILVKASAAGESITFTPAQ